MWRIPGTASIKISCRLPSSSVARMFVPVVLPSGRANDLTSPDPTMSAVLPRMGIVVVACCRARIAVSPVANNDIDLCFNQLRGELWNQINVGSKLVKIDSEVVAFNKASLPKFIKHFEPIWRAAWAG